MRKRTRAAFVVLVAAVAALTVLAVPAMARPLADRRADAVVLTLKGKDGTTKTFTMAELKAMPVFEGYAGFVNSANTMYPPHPVRGVKLTDLLAEVGYSYDSDVIIKASDGYNRLLAPNCVRGEGILTYLATPPTYPEVTMPVDNPLTAVLAYEEKTSDDAPWVEIAPPPMGDGPLRLWFAYPTKADPGYIVDGDWIVKWVNGLTVTGSVVEQWNVTLKGPKKTYDLTRAQYESCYNCHKTSVKLGGHTYRGFPLYLAVGKVDDNKDSNNWGDFNASLAKKGYTLQFVTKSGKKANVSSKILSSRPRNLILAWTRDGKYLSGSASPLWLIGPQLQVSQRVNGLAKMTLLFSHNRR